MVEEEEKGETETRAERTEGKREEDGGGEERKGRKKRATVGG